MKHSLLILLLFFSTLSTIYAKEENNQTDETTWNVIRERLFNGENSKAYRFEEDIRFQLIGANTHQDSAVFTGLIADLNELMETIQIKMVKNDPNFKLTIEQEEGGFSSGCRVQFAGYQITFVNLKLGISENFTTEKSIKQIYYHTIRELTEVYEPQNGNTKYGGIFTSDKPSVASFMKQDKDLIKNLYSRDFYKNLKENTIKEYGFENYLLLRYKTLFKNITYSLKAILILFIFLFLLSKESKRKQNPTLLLYLKQRSIILLALPFSFSVIKVHGSASYLFTEMPLITFGIFLITIIYGLLVLIVLYYTEPVFIKKINNFAGKQTFIFLHTIFTCLVIPVALLLLFLLFSNPSVPPYISFSSLMTMNSNVPFLIAFIATLRVFYNFITYRIQSMVNQKDVEIAKMKELKNQAELNALHSRINPHFLYNSLNSIASLAHIDANKTEDMATGLSDLFRYSINKENKTYVTVDEELEMVEKYLNIEKTRFGDRLVYEINTDDSTHNKQIPKFLIQPLVENAIKHGLSKMKDKGKIIVEVKQLEKDMIISIFDNGPDFPAEPVSGYGLQNLHDKLDIIYGKNAIINWENGGNKHFKITMKNQF